MENRAPQIDVVNRLEPGLYKFCVLHASYDSTALAGDRQNPGFIWNARCRRVASIQNKIALEPGSGLPIGLTVHINANQLSWHIPGFTGPRRSRRHRRHAGRRGQEQPQDAAVQAADRGPGQCGVEMIQNPLLTPTQVADRLQVSVAWVRDHSTRKHPRIPVVRVGGLLRYHPEDIDHWLQDLRGAGLRKAS